MHLMNHLVIRTLCVVGSIHIATAQGTTPGVPCPNISPCTEYSSCTGFTDHIVECNATMEEVKAAFSSLTIPITMDALTLYIKPSGDTIPADILGRNQVTGELIINGNNNFLSLSIDPDAFRSSKSTMQGVNFQKMDMNQVDFRFLAGSTQIYRLGLLALSNLHKSLPTLPALPGFSYLSMDDSTGLNQEWQNGTVFLPGYGLEGLYANNCGFDDKGITQLLDWVIPNAAETLKHFYISNTRFGSIPRQMRSFQSLYDIDISDNRVDLIVPNNSFNGSINQWIFLKQSRVIHVEPNAFLGNYSSNQVYLDGNLLTRFEEDVFKSMLQDMPGIWPDGVLFASGNPFDCYSDPCHLSWLLRDNRNLLSKFYSPPQCADGVAFEDLSPSLFQNCP